LNPASHNFGVVGLEENIDSSKMTIEEIKDKVNDIIEKKLEFVE
jgi:hypothetical protein